jgi:hypothetical protein
MQEVEAAIRDDEFFPVRAQGGTPRPQPIPGNDFLPEIHAAFWTNPFRLGNLFAPENFRV